MIKNFLKSAFRFLKRNKLFAGINILGLSFALAASFIILLFVINELSYNHCFKNRKQVYRVVNYYKEFKNTMSGTPYVLASALKDEFPQIEYATRVRSMRGFKLKLKEEFISVPLAMATGSEIFDIFNIPLIGSKQNILNKPNSIVLSKRQADKFFQGKNPVGEEIIGLVNSKEEVFIVKGVFEDLPVNSTFRADCFINSQWTLEPINKSFNTHNADVNWEFDFWTTWVMLKKGTNPVSLDNQLRELEIKNMGENPQKKYSFQNLSDVYLRSVDVMNTGVKGSIKDIKIFSSIALLIILVAAINYIILSTAVSSGRAKEIGIRKTNGAKVKSIKRQLLSESVFLALAVLPIAVLLAWFALPFAEKLFQTELYILSSNIASYIFVYLALTMVIGLVSGLYTSSYLSKLNVIDIIKNTSLSGKRKSFLRFALIVIQLVIFCSFISATLIIRSQYQYALKKDLGYQNKNILLLDLGQNFTNYRSYINTIKSYPNVSLAAGSMDGLPMLNSMSMMIPNTQDQTQKVKVEGLAVDYNFIEAIGITLLEGRSFSEEFGSDLQSSAILNETAVKQLGITDPIGKQIAGQTIIGVVKDFNLHSIHSDIPPLKIEMTDRYIHQVVINYTPGTLNSLLPMLKAEWGKAAPGRPFQFQTIEELIKAIYSSEKNLSIIISIFAIFSLLIAAFGLFGLTLFIAKTRTKEIGVKRVFGSSEKGIVLSFLRKNFVMVVIATILSVPPTILIMNRWLSNFAYKTNIEWWVFALAFIIAAFVVLLTVLYHSYRASRVNPVEALRYE